MMRALLLCSIFVLSNAKIQWSIGESEENSRLRRLDLKLTASTTNYTDKDCIVGGFDEDHKEKVYIGGPCSLLNITKDSSGEIVSADPLPGFRYLSMEVVDAGISPHGDDEDDVDLEVVTGSKFGHAKDETKYARVGTAIQMKIPDMEALIFSGQASYLAKATGEMSTNKFAFSKNDDGSVEDVEMCVAPCCDPSGGECMCADNTKCDGKVPYKAGQYKFSVYLASGNSGSATAGASGNGWEGLEANAGVDTGDGKGKILRGDFYLFQVVDFTNMNSDTLTITSPDGSSTTYASMTAFDGTNTDAIVDVKKAKIESGNWTAYYTFPTTMNKGSWSNNGKTIETDMTGTVKIQCAKTTSANLVSFGLASSTAEADNMKVLLFRYTFDISGITATNETGKWMTYDPTVTSSESNAPEGATPGAGGGDTGGRLSPSNSLLPSFAVLTSALAMLLLQA